MSRFDSADTNVTLVKSPPVHTGRRFLFQGSHVAKAIFTRGDFVRIADINKSSAFPDCICNENVVGNLCDIPFCKHIVKGIDTILHFAATMGGMGTIHEANDSIIFFYASSACVYPEGLQNNSDVDVSLKESDVWACGAPKPQGLYGLEKLVSELLLHQTANKLEVRIARFHNVFGPRGAWKNGREKVPAALLRKALAIRLGANVPTELEIWGDGTQRRSFLFIDDCVDAVLHLLDSSCSMPVNIGSDRSVTIEELAKIAIDRKSLESPRATPTMRS